MIPVIRSLAARKKQMFPYMFILYQDSICTEGEGFSCVIDINLFFPIIIPINIQADIKGIYTAFNNLKFCWFWV